MQENTFEIQNGSYFVSHYSDVIMSGMGFQITCVLIVDSAQIKENIKVPRHGPLCGEFTGEASNKEDVSIR